MNQSEELVVQVFESTEYINVSDNITEDGQVEDDQCTVGAVSEDSGLWLNDQSGGEDTEDQVVLGLVITLTEDGVEGSHNESISNSGQEDTDSTSIQQVVLDKVRESGNISDITSELGFTLEGTISSRSKASGNRTVTQFTSEVNDVNNMFADIGVLESRQSRFDGLAMEHPGVQQVNSKEEEEQFLEVQFTVGQTQDVGWEFSKNDWHDDEWSENDTDPDVHDVLKSSSEIILMSSAMAVDLMQEEQSIGHFESVWKTRI